MHVAIVCRGLGQKGSVAAVVLRQARELARTMRVTLVSDSFLPGETLPRVPLRMPGIAFLRRFRHAVDELAFARAARRALRSIAPDFALFHGHVPAYLSAPKDLLSGIFVHGDIRDRPRGTYDARLTTLYDYVTPRAYRKVDLVFAPARHFVELAERSGAKQAIWIPHGIDPAEIGLTGVPLPARTPGRLRILYVGRLAVEKGIEHLLDACALLSDLDWELSIVGAGPLASRLGARANDRIRLLGAHPRERLAEVYRAHDVFCTPALSEPFGLVVTEALLCGLPVIATRVGGLPELVQHGVNGLLVVPGDARALADAIVTVARDEALRARLAREAYASVMPRLEWSAIGDRMAQAIRDVARI